MGEESDRFRSRAKQCRELAKDARDNQSRRTLNDMAEDLDAEAGKIEEEEAEAKSKTSTRSARD
jgi:hypothetical protein